MDLNKKKMVFLGDSITEGVGTSGVGYRFWELVAQRTGAISVGYGMSGTRIARQQHPKPDETHLFYHFSTRVDSMDADADIIVVFGGVNDFGQGDAPFGTMTDRTEDSFYGALHVLYPRLMKRYPAGRIVVMTPLHFGDEMAGTLRNNGTVRERSLRDYVEAIRQVAEFYSLPILDLFRTSGIQPAIPAIRDMYIPTACIQMIMVICVSQSA